MPTDAKGPGAVIRRRMRRLTLLALPWIVVAAPPAGGQSVSVDEGVFLLGRDGEAIGTERFSIRRTGSGADTRFIATADVELELSSGERRISSALEVSASDLRITAYQVKVSGQRPTEIYMTLANRRFQARVVSGSGEELREYRASADVVILEEGIAHHHYFVAARLAANGAELPVIVPRAGTQGRIAVSDEGSERIRIAGQRVEARHLRLEDGSGVRDVWVDDRNRVLRVEHRGTGFRAERRDLPG